MSWVDTHNPRGESQVIKCEISYPFRTDAYAKVTPLLHPTACVLMCWLWGKVAKFASDKQMECRCSVGIFNTQITMVIENNLVCELFTVLTEMLPGYKISSFTSKTHLQRSTLPTNSPRL